MAVNYIHVLGSYIYGLLLPANISISPSLVHKGGNPQRHLSLVFPAPIQRHYGNFSPQHSSISMLHAF